MYTMIQIDEHKYDKMSENAEKMLKYGGKLMSCIEEMGEEHGYGHRYDDEYSSPVWLPIKPIAGQRKVLVLGENPAKMGGASMLKVIWTMLTNKAVGE